MVQDSTFAADPLVAATIRMVPQGPLPVLGRFAPCAVKVEQYWPFRTGVVLVDCASYTTTPPDVVVVMPVVVYTVATTGAT
jgi:hypothetical protein